MITGLWSELTLSGPLADTVAGGYRLNGPLADTVAQTDALYFSLCGGSL
jgi:hypothetical protein